MTRLTSSAIAIAFLSSVPVAQGSFAPPDEKPLPRDMTPAEARYVAEHPITSDMRAVTAPPSGPVHCVAEYEPMDGILIAWEGFSTIQAQMAAKITTVGAADVYVAVDTASEGNTAQNTISSYGADMNRVHTMVVRTDSVWIRDYGPRYVYQGDVRAIVDHTYNRPRPWDNRFSNFFSGFIGHPHYELQLVHGGGNYHLDATGRSYATSLISNENPGLTEPQIVDIWRDFQNVDTLIMTPLPSYVDSTQHIDMWLQVISDDAVIVSDWPLQSGSTQDQICDAAAVTLAGLGYTVHRIPAHRTGGTHYTFTNMVMCNDLVLLPSYTNSTVAPYNAQALAVVQAALPTKTVFQINAQAIVSYAGVFHCIVMHLPAHLGGVNPTAYVVGPDGGESFLPGDAAVIKWLSDDDEGVTSVDLLLSTDGGVTFPITIATSQPPSGEFGWTVPTLETTQARLRVVAYDGMGNSGSDDSDGDFTISSTPYAANIPYGAGKPGKLGVPLLDSPAPPVLGGPFTLELSRGLPAGDAYFIYGLGPDSGVFDGGDVLVDYIADLALPIDGAGTTSFGVNLPTNPNLAGLSFYWQVWIPNDPVATGAGWACSNGLETRLGF